MKTGTKFNGIPARIGAVVLILGLWQAAAMLVKQNLLLCSPWDVLVRLFSLIREGSFWAAVGFSLSRILLGFLSAFLLGILLAVLAGRFPLAETLLRPFVVSVKSIPVASFIIIALIWLSARQLSTFISFLMVFPVIYSNMLAGLKAVDPQLREMAHSYRIPFLRRFVWIDLIGTKPHLLSACTVALGLAWKSGIAAEVIGIPDGSIGEMLYKAKVYFDTPDLFAWTVVIVLASQGFEKLFLHLLRNAYGRLERC